MMGKKAVNTNRQSKGTNIFLIIRQFPGFGGPGQGNASLRATIHFLPWSRQGSEDRFLTLQENTTLKHIILAAGGFGVNSQLAGSPCCLGTNLGVSRLRGPSRDGAGARGAAGSKILQLGSSHTRLWCTSSGAAGCCWCGWRGKASG